MRVSLQQLAPGFAAGWIIPLLLAAGIGASVQAADVPPYVSARQVPVERFLVPPPALGSAAAQRDLQAVLDLQRQRTPAEVADAQADQLVSVFRFADVMGPRFTAERLPKTAALAQQSCRESSALTAAAKRRWNRPRPFRASAEVEPVLRKPADGSYPSGHATCGYLWAILLGEMLPEQREAIFRRGVRYGMNRAVGGVHYPGDVEAGRLTAAVIAAALFANEAFVSDFNAARAELRAVIVQAAALRR